MYGRGPCSDFDKDNKFKIMRFYGQPTGQGQVYSDNKICYCLDQGRGPESILTLEMEQNLVNFKTL
jgi:hypothetical protein